MMVKNEKKAHGVQLLIRAVVTDPDGKVISDTGERSSRSFVLQFLLFLSGVVNLQSMNAQDVTDTLRNIAYPTTSGTLHLRIDAGINDSDYGLVIGTGVTAEDNEDFALATQLTEGVGAGNITHASVTQEAVAVVGANVDLITKRPFTNNTGSTITVKEAGIYITSGSGANKFMIVRDVLAASVDVPDKCSITMFYTLRTTV